MKITAVTISKSQETFDYSIPFYCHTEDYREMDHHRNNDPERIWYITSRYNSAVSKALSKFPETEHILIIDSYYLHQLPYSFIDQYIKLRDVILGCSIWCKPLTHIWNNIQYYDTLSVKEFDNKRWHNTKQLPHGLIPVSAVGACWIFPRRIWNKFNIQKDALVNSSCLQFNHSDLDILLDCNNRLWRTRETNPDIRTYSLPKRIRVSLGEKRRQILS